MHEPAVVQAYQSAQHDLLIRYHYQQLDDTGTTYASSCFLVNSLTAGENHALVDGYLGGLSPEMPHPIRVQFYQRLQDLGYAAPRARPGSRDSEFTGAATMVTSAPAAAPVSLASSTLALASSSPDDAGPVGPMHIDQGDHAIVPVGEPCGWYYTATRSYSIVGTARGTLVRRGLYQAYLSGLGYTGYRGSLAPDGTHFGADLGENWCSEFYGGVASFELEGM